MSKFLYRYTCKPNYPFISKAVIIFQHPEAIHNLGNLLIIGRKLAEECGCAYAGHLEKIEAIGTICTFRNFNETIIHFETGEY